MRFNQTHLLEINEAIVITDNYLEFLDYRYHFQDEQNNLVFRYDSTPHFPNLSTFPHHKHLST
ncbi:MULTISPECIES: toxin TumE [Microcystis]|uniref:toxin TumE n=1 Tax=Microcystis TaxID=1125 RepID=UPI00338D52E5